MSFLLCALFNKPAKDIVYKNTANVFKFIFNLSKISNALTLYKVISIVVHIIPKIAIP